MAVFNSNKDLDSTIVVIGIHLLMAGAMYFHFTGMPAVKVSIQVQS